MLGTFISIPRLLEVSYDTLSAAFTSIQTFLLSYEFLFLAEIISVSIKLIILCKLFKYIANSKTFEKLWFFLLIALACSLSEDLTWILKILKMGIPEFDQRIWITFVRVSWACSLIQYQALALFIENLA